MRDSVQVNDAVALVAAGRPFSSGRDSNPREAALQAAASRSATGASSLHFASCDINVTRRTCAVVETCEFDPPYETMIANMSFA